MILDFVYFFGVICPSGQTIKLENLNLQKNHLKNHKKNLKTRKEIIKNHRK